jgi:hypothetical protein
VVKGLVALHGGDVKIRSTLGEGTRVTVRLPREGRAPAAATEKVAVIERLPPRANAPKSEPEFGKVKRSA